MENGDKAAPGKMKDWDVLFAIVLMATCAALVIYSLRISFAAMKVTKAAFYTAPGFALLIVGIVIFILAVILLVQGIKNGGTLTWLLPARLIKIYTSRSFRGTFLVFLYLFLYMWLFWEKIPFTRIRVPFWLGTFLFLVTMMTTFRAAKLKTILIVSAVVTAVVQVSFGHLAGIPLP